MPKNLIAHELTHTVQQGSKDALTSGHKETFGGGKFANLTLKRGTVLYRLCSASTRHMLSDYWIDQETFENLIRKVQTQQATFDYKTGQAGKRNQIRHELALLDKWGNSLTHRQKITLKKDLVAYAGPIRPQVHYVAALDNLRKRQLPLTDSSARKAKKQVEFRIGGLTQYVVPSFAKQYNIKAESNEFAEVQVFRLFKQRKHKPQS